LPRTVTAQDVTADAARMLARPPGSGPDHGR
jgi:hypothetical protein